MYTLHRPSQHLNGDFHWFLRTRFCRVVAQIVIVALVLVDAPFEVLKNAFAQSVTVFGPEDFVRPSGGGGPQTIRRNFNVSNPSGPATLCIDNAGTRDQYGFVTSAVVTLNNTDVIRPNDFPGRTPSVTKSVSLRSSNQLAVEVRSSSGNGFTLTIVRGGSGNCPGAAVNRPPVANAGPDQTKSVNSLVTLDGSGSSDPDGNPLTYQWSIVSKPTSSTATLSSSTAQKPTFTIDKAGTYTLQLIVNDGHVSSAPDQVVISTSNTPPVANAGPDQSGRVTNTITLDGTASSDIDGNSLTYLWSFVTKPVGSTAILSTTTAAKPTFTIDKAGTYTVQLVVNDGMASSTADRVDISTINSPPVANAGPDQSGQVTNNITLDGSGSTDVDGNTLTYQWSLTAPAGSTATLSSTTAVKPTFRIDKPGSYTAQLIVNDGTVNSTPDSVVISTTNSKPIADPGDPQTVKVTTPVHLDGSLSNDPDGDPLTYQWSLTPQTGSTATLTNPTTATPTFTVDIPGTYTAQLIVNDGKVDSDPKTVVISTTNSQPIADAGNDQTVTVNTLVQFDGTHSTDADHDPLTYKWSFTSSPQTSPPTLTNATTATPSFTPDLAGLYVVQLIVNDTHEDSAPVTVTITVTPVVVANHPPTISTTPVTTATVGQAYSYDVDATDPDAGDELTYSLTTAPTGMTINSGTGLIAWTPTAAQAGSQAVTVQVSDGHIGGTITQSFNVTVGAATSNHAPTITSSPGTTTTATVGQAYSYDVDATDPDAGDTLVYSLTTKPTGMTIDVNTGLISWTPAANQAGPQNVTVQISDGRAGGTVTQSFTITVSVAQANRPPVAQDDQYAVRRRQTLTVPAPGVLQNDTDPDNNSLTAQSVTNPTKGTATLAADGSFTYTPTEPPANSLEPELKFAFGHGSTLTQPIVIDLDKDGVPEIVFRSNEGIYLTGNLIALHGNDGSVAFSTNAFQTTTNPQIVLDGSSELAAGDIDGDGFPEIIAVDGFDGSNLATDIFRRQLIAFNHDGTYKWTSQDVVEDPLIDSVNTGFDGFTKPLIADINGDGTPEIIVGYSARGPLTPANVSGEDYVTVFDNHGQILWTARGGGSNSSTGVIVAQDIDLDGDLEILFSDDVFDHQGHLLRSASPCPTCLNVIDIAVANLDDDPFAEIVYLDRFGQLYVYEHTGVKKWGPLDTGDAASNLTIGDVDGDGKSEIVVMTGTNIHVVARDGASDRLIPIPFTAGNNSNGPTIFDLNGDGKPELIVPAATSPFDTGVGTGAVQQGAISIFDGQSGTQLYSIKSPNYSNRHEYPVVADVDGDGSAEIVTGGFNGSPLIHVFKAKNGKWAKTRPIYNQYNYNVTNVNSDGTIPAHPAINWLTPGLNNYRVNVPLPQERTGVDTDTFTYKANDGTLDSNTATAKIDILPPNTAPSILSQAPTTASPNLEYLYAVRAVDPDAGEVLTFALAQAPAGMTMNSATGLVRWTPTTAQVGNHIVALKVTDSQNQSAFQGFTITVGAPVTVPNVVGLTQAAAQTTITTAGLTVGTVISSPSATVPAGQVSSQEPSAGTGVPAGSAVNLVISSGPQGVSVPNVVGQTQSAAQTAVTGVGLIVGSVTTAPSTTVAAGNVISQTPAAGTTALLGTAVNLVVSVGIITLDGLTSIVVDPVTPTILVNGTQAFTATGLFNDGTSQNLTAIVTWTSSSPSVASVASNGVATGVADGTTTITANAGTLNGNTTLTVRAKVPSDLTPPTAAITTPTGGAEVTSPIDIIGTASDANFLKYELAYAPAGETSFTLLSTGTTAVTNGVLGKLDPTLLINDLYDVKLTVYDRGGNQASATVTVQVAREQKVGLFTITFQDLSIPLSGIPITINRTYDSRDKGKGDFGIGWRLDIQTLRLRPNREQGGGWIVNHPNGTTFTLAPVGEHKVSLTLPDGKVEEFDLVINPLSSPLQPFTSVTASYIPRSGTLGTLIPLDNTGLLITDPQILPVNDVTLLDDSTLNTFNPKRFRYVSADGTTIDIDRTKGVESVRDLNGNTLTISATGISHSSGKSVTFTRDAQGRITQLTDPNNNSQSYTYNASGDLISHADQAGNTTHFTYNNRHDLLQIIDPLNRAVARNEYDANGRLSAVTDAKGNRTTFTHDLNARQEVTTDRLGRVSVYNYDDKGNVLSRTNPLGETTTFTYDDRGNQLTERNALGHTTAHTYDSRNNLTSRTDPLGHTTSYSYNSRNQVVSITDPLGRTGSNSYDANGNLTSQTDVLGRTTTITNDSAGNQLAITDPLGNVSHNTYDATGNRTSLTQALSNVTSFTYDANGNLRSQADTTSPTYNLTYNAVNRPTTIAIGNVTRQLTYDAATQLTKATSPEGREAQIGHDALGLLTQITPSGGGSGLSQTHDAEGNVSSQSDFAGNVTRYTYDGADRLIQTTFPDGTTEQRAYDADGNLVQVTDALGRITRYTYDAANRQTSVIDALGNVTAKQYDAAGNLIAETDPLGQTTQYTYDAANQLVTTTFADGSTEQRSYDGLGRLTQVAGPTGNNFTYTYDALGRLTAVRDALGQSTLYEYNAAGQRSALVDANGNRTTFVYDDRGRLLSTTFPGGNTESSTYDIMGRELTTTNGNGDTIQYLYDTRGLPNKLTLPDGAQETYNFSADGLINSVTDVRGATQFEYHSTSRRLVRVTEPDGRYVRYAYDAVGNRTLMAHAMTNGGPEEITQYTYDALNRMTEVTDPSGGVARYTYDVVGNHTGITRPNGTTTTLTYNVRNRVTSIVERNAVGTTLGSETYTLDAAGNRTGESHADGSRVEYSYDATGKITSERHFDASNIIIHSVSYTYDAVGNLVGRTGTPGTASFTYNANNQLVSGDGITYTYDGAGNLLSETPSTGGITRYTYDARRWLVTLQPPTGAPTTYIYDFRGTRQSKSGPGGTVNFLIDRNNATGFSQVVRESDTTGTTLRSYVYGSHLLSQNQGGTLSYYHTDSLGSVRLLTNATGVPTDTYAYSAYGQLLARTGASINAYRFAGEQQDTESNLYYLRARYYNPALGRFLSRDPFDGDERSPLSLHKYLYAHGNPVNLRDPSGLFTLVEIQQSIAIIAQRAADQTPRAYKALNKAKEILGEGSKRAGGVMAINSVLGIFQGNFGLALRWFGPGVSSLRGIWNTARVAVDMLGAKQTRIDFDWDALRCRPGDWALVDHAKNGFRPGIGARANPAVVDLCAPFFIAPFLPRPEQGVTGTPSMAGVMVHEFTHITLGTGDDEYFCRGLAGWLGPRLSFSRLVANADTYRCFVRDSWLNGANLVKLIVR